jgi:hypothetical protein
MSEIAKLAASPRSDLLSGFTVSPYGLSEYGELESEFSSNYLSKVGTVAEQMAAPVAKTMIEGALERIARGYFNWGSAGFDACCLSSHHFPLMLHTSLKIKHPQLSRIDAAKLITPENEYALKRGLLELLGFKFDGATKKSEPSASQTTNASQSGGEESPLPSANAA